MAITAPTYNVKNGNSVSVTAFETTWSAGEVKALTEVVYLANLQEINYNPSLYLVEANATDNAVVTATVDDLAAGVTYTSITATQTTLAGTLGALDVALKTAQTDLALQATAAECITAVDAVVLAAATPNLGESLATLHLALEAIDANSKAAIDAAVLGHTWTATGVVGATTLIDVLSKLDAAVLALEV